MVTYYQTFVAQQVDSFQRKSRCITGQQPLARTPDHVIHAIETIMPAVVRVGHIKLVHRPFSHHISKRWIKRTKELDLLAWCTKINQIAVILLIHCEQQIKSLEIVFADLPRNVFKRHPILRSNHHAARVSRSSRVPTARAATINFEPPEHSALRGLMHKNRLRQWTATNVSEAYKEQRMSLIGIV